MSRRASIASTEPPARTATLQKASTMQEPSASTAPEPAVPLAPSSRSATLAEPSAPDTLELVVVVAPSSVSSTLVESSAPDTLDSVATLAPSSRSATLQESSAPDSIKKPVSVYTVPSVQSGEPSILTVETQTYVPPHKTHEVKISGFWRWHWMLRQGSTPTNLVTFPFWRYKGVNMCIHASPKKESPIVTAVKFDFDPFSHHFRICIGDPYDGAHAVWEDVKADSVWRPSAYSFSITPAGSNPDNGSPSRKTFIWKTPALGGNRQRIWTRRRKAFRYVELVDDANNVLAVLTGNRRLRAAIEWRSELIQEEELGCITVILGVLEKIRGRHGTEPALKLARRSNGGLRIGLGATPAVSS